MTALALVGLAVAGLAYQLATAVQVTWAAGCGDDGAQYCAMAAGRLATEPFSRRVLLPWVVNRLGLSGADGFAVVNGAVLVLCLAAYAHLCTSDLADGKEAPVAW